MATLKNLRLNLKPATKYKLLNNIQNV